MRLIDADALFDFLTDQLEKEVGFYSKGRNAGLNIARSALHDETIAPTISPLPNGPLTLAELREMDGEPVWITREDGEDCWTLIRYCNFCGIGTYGCGFLAFDDYSITWLAYRRRLEEGTA